MIDICMALDQSVSPHTGVRTIQNTGVFWQAVFQPPRPCSLFWNKASPPKLQSRTHTIPPTTQAIELWAEPKLAWRQSELKRTTYL